MKLYVEGADAQLLLNKFNNNREFSDVFKFDFQVDHSKKLKCLFWADSVGIQNYKVFGDAVSFDATYSTNRYNMIFAPFTGKDNHGGCVTFAAGLLTREDANSYSWLLNKFVECMGKSPIMLITDQDPGLKIAVEKVLPNTRHRYCMWHLMMKVAQKLPVSLRENADFKKKFDGIVWSEDITPSEFEEKWGDVMIEFDLDGERWFNDMFNMRSFWIPAYFQNLEMSGLFKTTSLSESENSFFQRYMNQNANLVEFYIHYGNAIKAQRHSHDKLGIRDETFIPQMKTDHPIERHASVVYTTKMFLKIQEEIEEAVKRCCLLAIKTLNDVRRYEIDDKVKGKFIVMHPVDDVTLSCSCNVFIKNGLLRRHMFVVLKNLDCHTIPERFIPCRWLKSACAKFVSLGRGDSDGTDGGNNKLFSEAFKCIAMVHGSSDLKGKLLADLNALAVKYSKIVGSPSTAKDKKRTFEMYYGAKVPDLVEFLPPDKVVNKGSCSRLKPRMEKAIQQAKKPKRRCGKCKELGHHDSRNCDREVEKEK